MKSTDPGRRVGSSFRAERVRAAVASRADEKRVVRMLAWAADRDAARWRATSEPPATDTGARSAPLDWGA